MGFITIILLPPFGENNFFNEFFQENRGLPSKIQVFTPFVEFLQKDMSFNWAVLMVMSLVSWHEGCKGLQQGEGGSVPTSWNSGIWIETNGLVYMGVSLNGGTPISHPKMIILSRKTNGCWGNPPFKETPIKITLEAFLRPIFRGTLSGTFQKNTAAVNGTGLNFPNGKRMGFLGMIPSPFTPISERFWITNFLKMIIELGGGFLIFFIFTPKIGEDFLFWRIFFKGVGEPTTN